MESQVTKAKAALIFSMLVFGSVGLLVRLIPLPASVIALSRAFLGGLFLFFLARGRGTSFDWTHIRENLFYLVFSGAIMGFNWIFLFKAFSLTTVAVAIICYYMAPILVILISPLVLKEKLSFYSVVLVLIAFSGMLLVSGVADTRTGINMTGVLYGLGAACLYAGVILCNKKLKGLAPMETTMFQLFSAAIVLLPYVLLTEDITGLSCTLFQFFLLMVLSLFVTGITYALFFGSMPYLSAQTIAIYTYFDPIVAVLLSVLVLHEPLTIQIAMGGFLILGATAVNEFMLIRRT